MPYFNPTINFNMLQYINRSASEVSNLQEVSNYFSNLLVGFLVVSEISLSLKDQSILCI